MRSTRGEGGEEGVNVVLSGFSGQRGPWALDPYSREIIRRGALEVAPIARDGLTPKYTTGLTKDRTAQFAENLFGEARRVPTFPLRPPSPARAVLRLILPVARCQREHRL